MATADNHGTISRQLAELRSTARVAGTAHASRIDDLGRLMDELITETAGLLGATVYPAGLGCGFVLPLATESGSLNVDVTITTSSSGGVLAAIYYSWSLTADTGWRLALITMANGQLQRVDPDSVGTSRGTPTPESLGALLLSSAEAQLQKYR